MAMGQFTYAETSEFSDMDTDHWAYDAVIKMSEMGIISGYDDGSFKPNEAISRAEFATVMVLTLGLEPNDEATSSFIDMDDDHWVVPYVDAAKSYLTGYSTSNGLKFKPDEDALREDMAVAIVRAKGYSVSNADLDYLKDYVDVDSIDDNLKPFVGAAIKNGVMVGSVVDGKKVFNPNDILTRAQAAALLLNIVEEEEKVVMDDDDLKLSIKNHEEGILLTWTVSDENNLEGFKIVASKSNDAPIYPEDGYMKYISDSSTRQVFLSGKIKNNNGDFSYLEAGQNYYFSVTALYKDEKVASPSVYFEYPEYDCEDVSILLKGYEKNGYVVLDWDVDSCDYISGYKIVASKSDQSPVYPDNGYYKYVNNDYRHIEIGEGSYYNNGDFKTFEAGQTYYFSLTALVGDGKVYSNTIALTFGEKEEPVVKLEGVSNGNQVVLEWSDYNDASISGFKVVASKSDGSPIYPEDGYFKYIPKGGSQRVEINVNDYYNGGDIHTFQAGESYNFSITALVGEEKYASNTVSLAFDEVLPPEVKLEAYAEGEYVYLNWTSFNDHHVEGFKVVASKYNDMPMYPDSGYYKYIGIGQPEEIKIKVGTYYNGGDIESFQSGETYYFSITTIYDGGKVASNTVSVTFK